MNKETECMLSSFRDASEKNKLEDTQRALISKSMNKYADRQSFSKQKSTMSVSSSLGTSYAPTIETSMTNVGKRKPYGYLTLLDISVLGGFSIPESSIVPDKEFVPNSFHQPYNESRWRSFVKKTPKWILKMGIEGSNKERKESRAESLSPCVLQRWTPILIEPNKLKLTGYLQSTSSPEVFHATDTIAVRKDFDCVRCQDGTVYKLQGPFEDPKHNIPSPIQQLLREGLPCKWKMMMEYWVNLLAQVKEQQKETAKSIATVTNQVGRVENTEKTAGYDESVLKNTAQPTATVMSQVGHVTNTEKADGFDEFVVTKTAQPAAAVMSQVGHVKNTEKAAVYDEFVVTKTAQPTATVMSQVGHVKNTEKVAVYDEFVVTKTAQPTATVMSQVGHTENTENTASFDEYVVTTPAQPTAPMTRHTKHVKNTGYTASFHDFTAQSDKKDSVNKGAGKKSAYRAGSLIPLEELDGQGIIQISSRGRIIVPPVRYWLGERLVQQDNQPTFFSPRTGVTKVVVNQSIDSIEHEKKRKQSESDARTSTITKKRHYRNATSHESENKLHTPRKEGTTLSHSAHSGWLQKADMHASQTPRTPEGKLYSTRSQKSILKKQQECDVRICESDDTMSDATFSEASEDNRILNRHKSKFKTPSSVNSKSVSVSRSLKDGAGKTKKYSLWTEKRRGLNNIKEFKTRRSKQKRNSCPSFCIYDSEEDQLDDTLLADLSTNIKSMAFRANSPLSSGSATLPTKHFNSMLDTEDTKSQSGRPGPLLQPHLRKEIERFIQRQQRIMGRDRKRSLLKPTVDRNVNKLITTKNSAGAVFTVQYDEVPDKASSFDEEDLSSSYISIEDKF